MAAFTRTRKELSGQTDCQSAAGQLIVLRSVAAYRSACCADRTKGDHVKAGQKIAEAGGFVSAPVYASVSGTVKGIEKKFPQPVPR